MNDYYLTVKLNGAFYFRAFLKADNREEALAQSNTIMNRFDLRYTATITEHTGPSSPIAIGKAFAWFSEEIRV